MKPFDRAQAAISELKAAVMEVLAEHPTEGLTNAEIGRKLGIYMGHVRHEGHIPRTILALLEAEGKVRQSSENKRWTSIAPSNTDPSH